MALPSYKYNVLLFIYKYTSLGSLTHAKIQDPKIGPHRKTKKIGGKLLKDETKWRAIFLKKEGKLSNRQIAACCKVSFLTVTNHWKYNKTGSMSEHNDQRTKAPRKATSRKTTLCVQVSVTD